jgi:hypothetical protein
LVRDGGLLVVERQWRRRERGARPGGTPTRRGTRAELPVQPAPCRRSLRRTRVVRMVHRGEPGLHDLGHLLRHRRPYVDCDVAPTGLWNRARTVSVHLRCALFGFPLPVRNGFAHVRLLGGSLRVRRLRQQRGGRGFHVRRRVGLPRVGSSRALRNGRFRLPLAAPAPRRPVHHARRAMRLRERLLGLRLRRTAAPMRRRVLAALSLQRRLLGSHVRQGLVKVEAPRHETRSALLGSSYLLGSLSAFACGGTTKIDLGGGSALRSGVNIHSLR